jgi:hypothetical protein
MLAIVYRTAHRQLISLVLLASITCVCAHVYIILTPALRRRQFSHAARNAVPPFLNCFGAFSAPELAPLTFVVDCIGSSLACVINKTSSWEPWVPGIQRQLEYEWLCLGNTFAITVALSVRLRVLWLASSLNEP